MASRLLVAPAVMDHGIEAEKRHMGDYRTKLRGKKNGADPVSLLWDDTEKQRHY